MNQSQSLYQLVQSLSANEIRYVTLGLRTHTNGNAYLKLFKTINSLETYDEKKLKHTLRNEPFIKHFAVIKNQLFQFILKQLRSYNESSSLDFKIKELLLDAAILYQKVLYRESWHRLQQARQLALQLEDWKPLLEILYKEFMLVPFIFPRAEQEAQYHRIAIELKQFVNYLTNYEDLAYYNILLTSLVKDTTNDPDRRKQLNELMTAPILQKESNALTQRARIVYGYIWSTYLINTSQYEKAEQHLASQLHLFEQNPKFIEWLPGIYMLALRDLVAAYYTLEEFEKASTIIQQLKAVPEKTRSKKMDGRRYRALIFAWTFCYEVGIATKTKSTAADKKYIREKETQFLHQASLFDATARLNTYLALAAYHYYNNDHPKTARLIQKILADPSITHHRATETIATLLQVALHVSEHNTDSISYLAKRIPQPPAGDAAPSRVELAIHKLINLFASANINTRKKLPAQSLLEFLAICNTLNSLKKINEEKQYFLFFDAAQWLILQKGKT